jgi:4-amino-4-deoxy-L-arabinose transferase-like glycosyltransferase
MRPLADFLCRLPLRCWLLFGGFFLLWNLNYAPFWNPDEGRYASSALEMARPLDGSSFAGTPSDWTVPRLNSVPRLNKPPLVYWLGALSFKLFGPSEWAARLVPALAACSVMLGLYFLGSTMWGERAGAAAAVIWATSLLASGLARTFNTDMLLSASTFFAFGGIFLASEETANGYGRIRPYLWAGIGLGLALISKGPVGVALPLLIGAVYLCVVRRWKQICFLRVTGALVLALLIGLPWYFAVEAREPGFIRHFIFAENLGRFSGKSGYHNATPAWYYLPVVLLGMMPWSGFWLAALARTGLCFSWRSGNIAARGLLFCWLWGILLVAFFSVSGTKLISYVLPAFPAFALLMGEAFGGEREWSRGIQRATLAVASVLSIVLAAGAALYLTNEKTLPASIGQRYGLATVFILLATTAALWKWQGDRWKLFGVQSIGAGALLLLLLSLAGRVAPYEDASPMVQTLVPHMKPDDVLLEYRMFQPTAIFYTARAVPVYEFVNNSGLDEQHPNYVRMFPPATHIATLKRGPQRIFALMRWNHGDTEHFVGWNLIARNNDFRLFSNRPAPAGFSYDFTAPGKRDR